MQTTLQEKLRRQQNTLYISGTVVITFAVWSILRNVLYVLLMGVPLLEARRYEAQHWRLKLINGIVNILLALSCLIFIRSMRVAVYVYCIGLCYSACMRIISAFRKNAIVYIQ